MIIFRHILIGVFCSILVSALSVGVTFLAFPIESWSDLLNKKIYDISYLFIVSISPLVIGSIIGISTGVYVQQRVSRINRMLDDIVNGQKVTNYKDQYKELATIQKSIEKIQDKLVKQTELSQRIATERANEREKSLQEVVIQERNRLARELHDSVSQQLFAASMMMSAINESLQMDDQNKHQLMMIENMIHQSQLEMRALLMHLRPVALKGRSLQEGIEELLIELTDKIPIEVDWKVETFNAAKGIEDQLFRILQECVSNTLRHAKASSLQVLLIERDDLIILRVVDDGIGFNMSNVRTGSYGLANMEERAVEIGGTFKLVSLENQGTKIEVKVPLIGNEGENHD